jgi:hypothetical protein
MPLAPVPFRTPLLVNKPDLLNQPIWMRWLIELVQAVNSLSTFVGVSTGVTVAKLPGSPVAGQLAQVTDSTTNVWGAAVTGTGGFKVLAWFNGSQWTVVGK